MDAHVNATDDPSVSKKFGEVWSDNNNSCLFTEFCRCICAGHAVCWASSCIEFSAVIVHCL